MLIKIHRPKNVIVTNWYTNIIASHTGKLLQEIFTDKVVLEAAKISMEPELKSYAVQQSQTTKQPKSN